MGIASVMAMACALGVIAAAIRSVALRDRESQGVMQALLDESPLKIALIVACALFAALSQR